MKAAVSGGGGQGIWAGWSIFEETGASIGEAEVVENGGSATAIEVTTGFNDGGAVAVPVDPRFAFIAELDPNRRVAARGGAEGVTLMLIDETIAEGRVSAERCPEGDEAGEIRRGKLGLAPETENSIGDAETAAEKTAKSVPAGLVLDKIFRRTSGMAADATDVSVSLMEALTAVADIADDP